MSKRVIICSNPSMFGQGIEACIDNNPELELAGSTADPDTAIRLIKETSPDVVLLVTGERQSENWSAVQRLLVEGLNVKIIHLDIQSELVGIYLGEQQKVRDFSDLVQIILDDETKDNNHS